MKSKSARPASTMVNCEFDWHPSWPTICSNQPRPWVGARPRIAGHMGKGVVMKICRASLALALSCLLLAAGCNQDNKSPQTSKSGDMAKSGMATRSLYDRLGGEPAITAVIDDFVNRAAGDPKVNFTRKGTDKEWSATPENVIKLKRHLTQIVCMVTGRPQKNEGKPMKPLHAGMKITEAEF